MNRRKFLKASSLLPVSAAATFGFFENGEAKPVPPPPPLPFRGEKSNLKITGVRVVDPKPQRPLPVYEPAPVLGRRIASK